MTPPFLGLEIAVLSSDLDVVELRVAAWNGAFAGLLRLYVGHGYLDELADQIAGFPTGLGDERSFALTDAIQLRFRCVDAVGHAAVDVSIRDEPRSSPPAGTQAPPITQTVFLTLRTEAAAIDEFVRELRIAERRRDGAARLRGRESER
jgi:hypothetical protein